MKSQWAILLLLRMSLHSFVFTCVASRFLMTVTLKLVSLAVQWNFALWVSIERAGFTKAKLPACGVVKITTWGSLDFRFSFKVNVKVGVAVNSLKQARTRCSTAAYFGS